MCELLLACTTAALLAAVDVPSTYTSASGMACRTARMSFKPSTTTRQGKRLVGGSVLAVKGAPWAGRSKRNVLAVAARCLGS
jgi:hypothetical protein